MKLGRKVALAGIGGIVLLGAAGYFASQRYLTSLMAKEIEARSGLHAAVRSVELSFWPNIRINVDGIALAKPDGTSLLSIDQAGFGLSFDALLHGKVRVTGLSLTHPVLRIVEKQGEAAPSASSGSGLPDIGFAGPITVSDGVLIDDNQRRQVETRIEKIDLSAERQPGGSLALKLAGDVQGVGLRIDGLIASAKRFAAGEPTNFDGTLAMGAQEGSPHAVHAKLRLAAPVLAFDEVHANWTQASVRHNLTAAGDFRWDGDAPKLTAHVNVDTLDLDLPNVKDLGKTSGNGIESLSDHPIDFHELRALDAAIDVNASDVTGGTLHIGPAVVAARLDDGRCNIALAAENFYRGKAAARLLFDASLPTPTQAVKANFTAIDSAPLLKDLSGATNVGGTLNFGADLSSRGASPRAIARNLAGAANLQFANGVVTGLNLPDLFRTVSQYLPKAWQDLNNQITINSLTANFQLAGGQAATNDLHIVSPVLDVTGKGTIDLANRQFDLRFDPKVVRNANSDTATPVSPLDLGAAILIRGPWANPQITADLSSMMQNPEATVNKLEDLGQQLLGDKKSSGAIMKGLGDLLQGFGPGGSGHRGGKSQE